MTNYMYQISIIIPSYNRYPQLAYTLLTLEQQTFDKNKMEVIVVDDHSTDGTYKRLSKYQPDYPFKIIQNSGKQGAASARNVGIEASNGEIIIFLDAENLVDPNFVEYHFKYHQVDENLVVSGSMLSRSVYTVLHPEFSKEEIKQFYNSLKRNSNLLKSKRLSTSNHQRNFRLIWDKLQQLNSPSYFLSKQEVAKLLYRKIAFSTQPSFYTILKKHGSNLKGYNLPWISFITRNVSVRRNLLEQVGYFDEDFNGGWGLEDWELGYRLHKTGASFIFSKNLISYHQEHPKNSLKRKEGLKINYELFKQKHPDKEVQILSLFYSKQKSLYQLSELLEGG